MLNVNIEFYSKNTGNENLRETTMLPSCSMVFLLVVFTIFLSQYMPLVSVFYFPHFEIKNKILFLSKKSQTYKAIGRKSSSTRFTNI